VDAVHNGVIHLFHLPVFKLHGQAAVRLRVLGNGQDAGGLLSSRWTHLRIGVVVSRHPDDAGGVAGPFVEGGYVRRLVYDDVIFVFNTIRS
jgi:hypothetical protein